MSINLSHLLGFKMEGSGRLNVLYFTCLEAQNVDKYITFAWFWEWKALGSKINRILRVWKALGGSMCRTVRVWKFITSINTSHLLGFRDGRLQESKSVVFYVSGRL